MNPVSNFDPNVFMQSSTESALSTKSIPIPVGDYLAQIVELEPRNVQGARADNSDKWYQFLDMMLEIRLPPQVAQELGREVTKLKHSVSLDLTEQGNLDYGKGKNIGLGQTREAANQNIPGQPWNPSMLKGAMIMASIIQEPDKKDPEVIYNRVKKVGRATT